MRLNAVTKRSDVQAIVMRFDASSGVVLGNVTFKTPLSIDALISSSCKKECQRPTNHRPVFRTYLDTLRKLKRPRVFSKATLAHSIPALVEVDGLLGLSGHRKLAVLDIDLDALFRDSGELERRSHQVLVCVFVQVKSEL